MFVDREYEVILPLKKLKEREIEIFAWCHENFGDRCADGLWYYYGYYSPDKKIQFVFLRETDAMAFKLRWL